MKIKQSLLVRGQEIDNNGLELLLQFSGEFTGGLDASHQTFKIV